MQGAIAEGLYPDFYLEQKRGCPEIIAVVYINPLMVIAYQAKIEFLTLVPHEINIRPH